MINTPPARYPLIDIARGAALFAMILFHFCWNLDAFGFTRMGVFSHPAWLWFARLTAGGFLLICGVCLVLAANSEQPFEKRLLRILKLALAAGAISGVTYIVFGEEFVYFGILHHIALASLFAQPFLRLHWSVSLLFILLIAALHQALAFEALNSRALAWLGLASDPPFTLDYVPLIPWFAVVLAGLILGKALLNFASLGKILALKPAPLALLSFMGRHTLVIYLVHQPALFGLAYMAKSLLVLG